MVEHQRQPFHQRIGQKRLLQLIPPEAVANDHVPEGVPLFAKVSDRDKKFLTGANFHQIHISCKTLHPEEEDVIEFLEIVADPANQPVFVHCRDGTDRTGMMAAVYRMVVQDWPREKALAEMKAFGFNEIWDPLEDYIEEVDVDQMKSKLSVTNKLSSSF